MIDNIKFVIWGAGARGRRLLRFLGSERVAAYIDGKPSLQGTFIDDTPVMSVEEYLQSNLYGTTWVVNTPLFLRDEVQKQISDAGITKYFSLKDCPDEFYDYKFEDVVRSAFDIVGRENECYLYGFNLYSFLISEKLAKKGKKVIIVVPDKDFEKDRNRIDGIRFISIVPIGKLENITLYWSKQYDSEEIEDIKKLGFIVKFCGSFDNLEGVYGDVRLKQYRNKYKGQRCFVVATGPSLRLDDLETLHRNKEFCISLNGIYHSFANTAWRPNMFVITDPNLIEWIDIIKKMDVECKLISDNNMDFWKLKHDDNIYRLHIAYSEIMQKFSADITRKAYSSGNVTYCCLQVAVYMGFSPIYLLGVDFSNISNTHFVAEKEYLRGINSVVLAENCYTEKEAKEIQRRGYVKAEEYARKNGIKIINATRGGALDIFERCSFDSLF